MFESNTRDLQTLEARVVINITEFYTYMKAFRDYLRTLAEITPQSGELDSSSSESLLRSWHEAVINVVFMLFLGLESARHAIADLVEFQPEKAERTIVILISELEAYRFLRSRFTDERDVRCQRLKLREPVYRRLVPKLISSIKASRAEEKPPSSKRNGTTPHRLPDGSQPYGYCPNLKLATRRARSLIPPTTARVGRNNASLS